MNRKILYLAFIFISVGIWACQNPHPGYEKTTDGLYYKFHNQNEEGMALDSGDRVTLNMRYYTNDSVYFNSEKDMPDEFIITMQKPRNSMDLFSALTMMKVGDSATFIMPPDSLLGSNSPAEMDSIDELFVDIKLLERKTLKAFEQEQTKKRKENRAKEQQKIKDYLSKNNLDPEMTPAGIYILEHQNTGGTKVDSGKVAVINFKGSLLTGNVFQETSPEFPYIVGQTNNYPFKWDEMLLKMHQGDKGKFILPSHLALGKEGARGIIPPFSPVLIEISIEDIMNKEEYQEQKLAKEKENRATSKQKLDAYLNNNNIDKVTKI